MFKIECLVKDDKLAATLWALSVVGAYDVMPTPVANAKVVKGGQVRAQVKGGADATAIVWDAIHGMAEVTVEVVNDIMTKNGLSKKTTFNVLRNLTDAKRLKRVGRGTYDVVKRKGK